VLKRYASIQDIVRDLRKLRKSAQLITANILEDDDDDTAKKSKRPVRKPPPSKLPVRKSAAPPPHKLPSKTNKPSVEVVEAPSAPTGGIKMRRSVNEGDIATPQSPGQRFNAQPKLDPKIEKQISAYNDKLNLLVKQHQSVNHIVHLLQTDFANSTNANVDRLQQIAKRLLEHSKKHILINEEKLEDITRAHPTNDILFKLANSVSKKLTDLLGSKEKNFEQKAMSAMIKDRDGTTYPQHTVYLIYHNLENDVGYVFPQKIYALSLYRGHLYLNTNEHTVRPPGQWEFTRGTDIPYHKMLLSRTTEEVMKYIKGSMRRDNLVEDLPAMTPPFTKSEVNPKSIEHVTDFDILPDGTMTVRIDKAVGNEIAAMNVLNQVQVHLHSALLLNNPKTKARIIPSKPKKIPTGYSAVLKLIPGGQASGKTLMQEVAEFMENKGIAKRHIHRFRQIVQEE
jgi:hypothetical protein